MTHENPDEPCHLLRRGGPADALVTLCGLSMSPFKPGHWITGTVAEVDCKACLEVIDASLAGDSVEAVRRHFAEQLADAKARAEHYEQLINTPHTEDFLGAVKLEAIHQRERWGTEHDAGKEPADWFWLLGYLAGKALKSAITGDLEKALHHTISSGAVLLNWHAALSGADTRMRPGIDAREADGG